MKKTKSFVSLALMVLMLVSMVPTALAATSPVATETWNGHTYELYDESMTWTEAKARCETLGGHLVTITSQQEQTFIEGLISKGSKINYWLGGTDADGDWTWVTGEAWSFTNWAPGEPQGHAGEHYLHIMRQDTPYSPGDSTNQWNDIAVDGVFPGEEDFYGADKYGFICEYDSTAADPAPEEFWSNASDWAKEELLKADELGLVPESLKNEDLTKPINRTEFAAVAVKVYESLSGTTALPTQTNPFTDTSDPDVLKAYNIGAVNGTSATTFSPKDLLNREQAATMLTRVFKRVTVPGWTLATDTSGLLDYMMPPLFSDDADISDYAKDSVYFMSAWGIINGVGNNKFAPKNVTSADEAMGYANATREQALLIAVRMAENLK